MKRFAKIVFTFGLLLILTGVILLRKDSISTIFNTYFSSNNSKIEITDANGYYRHYDFMFVKQSTDYVPYSIIEIMILCLYKIYLIRLLVIIRT